jgi:hypothetical protein
MTREESLTPVDVGAKKSRETSVLIIREEFGTRGTGLVER